MTTSDSGVARSMLARAWFRKKFVNLLQTPPGERWAAIEMSRPLKRVDSYLFRGQYPWMRVYRGLFVLVGLLAVLLVGGAGGGFGPPKASAFAVTRQWTGGGLNSNWTNPANWLGAAAPLASPITPELLLFPPGATRLSNTNDFPAGKVFDQIVLTGSGYTLGGNRVSLNGQGIASGLTASHASGTNAANLAIEGTGGVTVSGGGRLELAGANTFSGDVHVTMGALRVKSATALGSLGGLTTVYATAGAYGGLEIDGSFTLAEFINLDYTNANLLRVLSGSTTIDHLYISSPVCGIEVQSGADLTINGDTGLGDIQKSGLGSLTMNGATDGAIVSSAGHVTLNGIAHGVRITGGTLSGKGETVGLNLTGGAFVLTDDLPGFHSDGQATFSGTSTLAVALRHPPASGSPLLIADQAPALNNAQFTLNADSVGPPGGVFTIVSNPRVQPIIGTFNGLPEGAVLTSNGVRFRISYLGGSGHDITLTVLPSSNADLRVSATVAPEPAPAGGTLVYSAQVTNTGPADAQDVVAVAQVPAGTSFLSVAANVSWICTVPPVGAIGQVRCKRDTLASGTSSPLVLTVRVDSGRTANIATAFSVSGSTPDPVLANNETSVTTHIAAGAPALSHRLVVQQLAQD